MSMTVNWADITDCMQYIAQIVIIAMARAFRHPKSYIRMGVVKYYAQ